MLSFLVLSTIFLPVVYGCSCYWSPPQKQFCDADWVSHVRIRSSKILSDQSSKEGRLLVFDQLSDRVFDVEHIEVFKRPSNLTALPNTLSTKLYESLCGLNLNLANKDEQFLLAGRLVDKQLRFDLCSQVAPSDYYPKNYRWEAYPSDFPETLRAIKC
ncbi:unnamed protein product, partial [Mesorhabditis belari]|uniref:NTR domain-containing protein n=1 Tax=Mesorhabditis belari TaxID=2138241 RepID=A0AAF3F5S3_9BILA